IRQAKEGNTLGSNAYNLFYATDFADRLERQIIPALRAGFVMLTDRYTYSLIARAIVRGADPDWIKNVYSFSLKPDAVFYLRIQFEALVPRIGAKGGFVYGEPGRDFARGADLFDCFVNSQPRVIEELDHPASVYPSKPLDAPRPEDETAEDLADRVLR